MAIERIELGVSSAAGSCDAHSCGCGSTADASAASVTTELQVSGMTCSHCVASVTEELSALPSVSGVTVELAAGGVSTVKVASTAVLDQDAVRTAIETAGYALA